MHWFGHATGRSSGWGPAAGFVVALGAIALFASEARADRAVTAEERAAITAALEAEGCRGGEMEYDDDDDDFEVEDAQCADGSYDFELTRDFQIRERERDD